MLVKILKQGADMHLDKENPPSCIGSGGQGMRQGELLKNIIHQASVRNNPQNRTKERIKSWQSDNSDQH